ncbi:MAG TPA: Asp23/Gls24 family envelope stress response protein [Acidimicrobiales bacterium]|nr:Asp23/Gls24 family envelope stress response protein [Acidimicrobiales bacterium]
MTDLTVSPSGPASRPPAERGALDIADRVVTKIAAHSAGEIDGVEPRGLTWLGRLFGGSSPDAGADAEVDVEGSAATIELTIGVRYPRPVWDTAAQVRRHVALRLEDLVGLADVVVRVEIAELMTGGRQSGPQVI